MGLLHAGTVTLSNIPFISAKVSTRLHNDSVLRYLLLEQPKKSPNCNDDKLRSISQESNS